MASGDIFRERWGSFSPLSVHGTLAVCSQAPILMSVLWGKGQKKEKKKRSRPALPGEIKLTPRSEITIKTESYRVAPVGVEEVPRWERSTGTRGVKNEEREYVNTDLSVCSSFFILTTWKLCITFPILFRKLQNSEISTYTQVHAAHEQLNLDWSLGLSVSKVLAHPTLSWTWDLRNEYELDGSRY